MQGEKLHDQGYLHCVRACGTGSATQIYVMVLWYVLQVEVFR
jgi:hypothetical protein